MPLVTASQFGITPDVQGSMRQGLANRALTQDMENKVKLQGLADKQRAELAQQKQTRLRAQGLGNDTKQDTQEQAGLRMLADDPVLANQFLSAAGIRTQAQKEEASSFAAQALSLPIEQRNELIKQRALKLESEGRDASNTRGLLTQDPNQQVFSLQGLSTAALTAQQSAMIPSKAEASQIRRETFKLKKDAAELRRLEALTARETNALRKQELELKLSEKKKEIEQNQRNKEFDNKSALDGVDASISTIDRLLKGDKLESAAGLQANFPTLSGTNASDFEAQLETLQSQAFLSQVEKMKGMGALSENEGKKLGSALGSLTINMSDKSLRDELKRVKTILVRAKERMASKFGNQPQETVLPSGWSVEVE